MVVTYHSPLAFNTTLAESIAQILLLLLHNLLSVYDRIRDKITVPQKIITDHVELFAMITLCNFGYDR